MTAERSFLHGIGGGCHSPVGAWGRVEKGLFKLDAVVGTNDGSEIIRHSTDGKPEDAQNLAIQLAKLILVQGRN